MNRREGDPPDSTGLVHPTDPEARVFLGSTPYTEIPIDTPDPGIPVATDELNAGGSIAMPDRTLTPLGASYHPDPQPIRVVGTKPDGTAGPGRGDQLDAELETFTVGAQPGPERPKTLADLVERGRTAGVAIVVPGEFQAVAQAAQIVLTLTAAGVPVAVEDPTSLARWLHPDLLSAIKLDASAVLEDPLAWGWASVTQRRIAWRHHDLRFDWPNSSGPRLVTPAEPTVSVVLATRRPEFVPDAIAMMASQDHGRFELIAALHGCDGQAQAMTEAEAANAGLDALAIAVDEAVPFGAVLNRGIRASSGQIVTKWDDDDHYGPHHLTDLTLALRYSGAGMVGKAAEFIHFADEDYTILRAYNRQESWSRLIAGGTLTSPRLVLDDLGGFPPIPRSVDHYLKLAVERAGLGVYRTHGFEFVLERRTGGHTWTPKTGELERDVFMRFQGIPTQAGVGGRNP